MTADTPAPADTVDPDLVEVAWTTARDKGWRSHTDEHTYAVDRVAVEAMVAAVLTALAERGALMPTGGETVVQQHAAKEDPWRAAGVCTCGTEFWEPTTHRRTVTTYPEGHPLAGTHYGPWRSIDG